MTTILELGIAPIVIPAGAAFFTNAVETLGGRLGMRQGAVGSLLAAVGTALPESMIAVWSSTRCRGPKPSWRSAMGSSKGSWAAVPR